MAMKDISPEGKLLMPCQILVSHTPCEPRTFPHLTGEVKIIDRKNYDEVEVKEGRGSGRGRERERGRERRRGRGRGNGQFEKELREGNIRIGVNKSEMVYWSEKEINSINIHEYCHIKNNKRKMYRR